VQLRSLYNAAKKGYDNGYAETVDEAFDAGEALAKKYGIPWHYDTKVFNIMFRYIKSYKSWDKITKTDVDAMLPEKKTGSRLEELRAKKAGLNSNARQQFKAGDRVTIQGKVTDKITGRKKFVDFQWKILKAYPPATRGADWQYSASRVDAPGQIQTLTQSNILDNDNHPTI